MRILIATNGYPTKKNPARQVFIRNIKQSLTNAGHDCSLVYNRYFDWFSSPLETGTRFTSIFRVVSLILSFIPAILWRAREADIIYSHAPFLPGLLMTAAARLHKVKHVVYVHGSVNSYTQKKGFSYKLAAYAMRHCDKVFTNSSYMKQRLQDDYGIKSSVVTPGYKSDVFRHYGRERTTDMLFAGNCIRRKGVHVLLHAIREYRQYYLDNEFRIRICCSGILKPEVVRFSKSHQLDDILSVEEKLQEQDLAEAFNRTKIVLFPSLEEALGLVGIEAIACGAFLIASNTGGIPEYINHGVDGLLVEPGSSRDLHLAIKKAFHEQLWKRGEQEIRESENRLKKYSVESGTKEAVRHFEALLSKEIGT
jgi:glycosyltransferase involved in cell wall biosynthesis